MINIKRYVAESKIEWDDFISNSKNGTFMLKRDYMDYHHDRFLDCSLMFYEEEKLIAVMPASLFESEHEICSHAGLTYGGIISDLKMTTQKMLAVFCEMKSFFKSMSIKKIIYKRVPSIYYSYPSDEDLYALFLNNADLYRRDISTTIFIPEKIKFNERRRRNIKKAIKSGCYIKQENNCFSEYWKLLEKLLKQQHNTVPVHSLEEITALAANFPHNIKLFSAYQNSELVSGVVIFETDLVAHAQYIASNDVGRITGGLDFIFDYLINEYYKHKRYFDFGISNENSGRYLNSGLISQKQEFGGRGITHDFYIINLD